MPKEVALPMADDLKLSTSKLEMVLLSASMVLVVRVWLPVSVTTSLPIFKVGFPETPSPLVTVILLAVPVMVLVAHVSAAVRAAMPVVERPATAVRSESPGCLELNVDQSVDER